MLYLVKQDNLGSTTRLHLLGPAASTGPPGESRGMGLAESGICCEPGQAAQAGPEPRCGIMGNWRYLWARPIALLGADAVSHLPVIR